MNGTAEMKLKWQLVPTLIFLTVMVGWLVLETTGVLSLESMVQGLSQVGLLLSALIIILVLAVDLFIPIPSTLVIPLAGHLFGVLPGTLVAVTGSMLLSVAGYWLGRTGGHALVRKIVSQKEIEKMELWMKQYGKWPVLLSKTFPMMAETVSVTSGIARMAFLPYLLLSLAGTVPVCFLYVFAGNRAENVEEIFIIAVGGFLITLGLFFAVRAIHRKRKNGYNLNYSNKGDKRDEQNESCEAVDTAAGSVGQL